MGAAVRPTGVRSLRAGSPGTFLTGVTSSVLMGVALFAALDGREQLATPPEIAELVGARGDWRFGRIGQDRPAVAAATDIQSKRSPPHGSLDGHQGRRPRRDSHHALRADQDGACRRPQDQPRLSGLRPARDFCRGRGRPDRLEHDRADLRRQGRERHEPEDRRFPARPGDLRREERIVRPTRSSRSCATPA